MESLQLFSCPGIGNSPRPLAMRCSGSRSELVSNCPRTVAKKRALSKHQCTVMSTQATAGSTSVGLHLLVSQMGSESSKTEPRVVNFKRENMVLRDVDRQTSTCVSKVESIESDHLALCRNATLQTEAVPQSRHPFRESGTEKGEGLRLDKDEISTVNAPYNDVDSASSRQAMLWAQARHRRERRRQAARALSGMSQINRDVESMKVDTGTGTGICNEPPTSD